jgi:hypothetical protein
VPGPHDTELLRTLVVISGTRPRQDAASTGGLEEAVFDIHLGKMIMTPSIVLGLQRLVRYQLLLYIEIS